MRAAALDRVIVLKPRTDSMPDAYGVVTPGTGVPEILTRAELLESKLEDVTHSSGLITKTVLSFRLRYVGNIRPGDILAYEDGSYEILTIKEIGRRKALELTCRNM